MPLIRSDAVTRAMLCARRSCVRMAGSLGLGFLLLVLPSVVEGQVPTPKPIAQPAQVASAFTLATSPIAIVRENQVVCPLINSGYICADVIHAPFIVGFLWPADTHDNYMFGSGIQVTGIVTAGPGCTAAQREASVTPDCFVWSGDTTGALFHDASGLLASGAPVAGFFDGRGGSPAGEWLTAGFAPDFPSLTSVIRDSSIFHPSLIGQKTASGQDTWAAYWDGDPTRGTNGRSHPMGILVEQRSLAWNYPDGNDATIFFVFRITNVTDNPRFQTLSEERLFAGQDRLPDAGWRMDSLYFTWSADPDIGIYYSSNHLTAVTPFDMMLAYQSTFVEDFFEYPPAQFHSPFMKRSPGMIGMKFLRTPEDPVTGRERGLTSVNSLTSGGAFPAPGSVQKAWRYASLNLDPQKYADPNCMIPGADTLRWCYMTQAPSDVRGIMSTGPFSLGPGESETVVIAMFAASTVETPLLSVGAGAVNPPGLPTLSPGCGTNPIRPIEVGAGWISTPGCPAAGEAVEQRSAEVVPGSLLGKALVAQTLADNRFVMPAAPEPPPFYLVASDDRVTVVWEPSATEAVGDPFFPLASDPASPLYDPNYRGDDVEGYRIYRGVSPDAMELIAQFDSRGTVFTDALCRTDPDHINGTSCDEVRDVPLTGDLVQYRTVTELANGSPIIIDADTALAEAQRNGTALPLNDTGIPFAFIDTEVRSGFRYYYRVTAFDINSLESSPTSLESTSEVKHIMPRSVASSTTAADVAVGLFGRTALLPGATPAIDPLTGTFDGPQAPTTLLNGDLTVIAGHLLARGSAGIRIDSIVPGYYPNGTIATYHLTVDGEHATVRFTNRTTQAAPGTIERVELPTVRLESDPDLLASFRQRGVDAPPVAAQLTATIEVDRPHWNSLHSNWAYKQPGFWYSTAADPPASGWAGGSRWFTGETEAAPHPTADILSHGTLDGIAAIFQPTPYLGLAAPAGEPAAVAQPMAPYRGLSEHIFRRFYGTVLGVTRAADVRLYWGTAGLDSVIDVTHDVPVPFSPAVRASYGFLTDADADGVLTYGDFYYLEGLETSPANEIDQFARAARPLSPQPVLEPVDISGDLIADGTGFGLYINGEPYLFLGSPLTSGVWTLRTYNGAVSRAGDGTYSFMPTGSNPAVPGLRLEAVVNTPGDLAGTPPDLTRVHTVPDPYYSVSRFDRSPEFKQLQFVNLPVQATIRIYTLSGVLVDVIVHDDPAGNGTALWDLRGRGNHRVASGVYLFHVSTPAGRQHVGRFTVVSSGW
ncbi:MAG TPA: hypothetical protein VK912_06020 [Longimicrobiales bacterium]|nr:hypothetical protein [Longimicrobiales bacterium]